LICDFQANDDSVKPITEERLKASVPPLRIRRGAKAFKLRALVRLREIKVGWCNSGAVPDYKRMIRGTTELDNLQFSVFIILGEVEVAVAMHPDRVRRPLVSDPTPSQMA